jgi:hypothetical protein
MTDNASKIESELMILHAEASDLMVDLPDVEEGPELKEQLLRLCMSMIKSLRRIWFLQKTWGRISEKNDVEKAKG